MWAWPVYGWRFLYWQSATATLFSPAFTFQSAAAGETKTLKVTFGFIGDVNLDCRVNVLDLILIRNRLGQSVSSPESRQADINGDGRINVLDLVAARSNLNTRCQ